MIVEEIVFIVDKSQETGYVAKALEVSIYTQAETIEDLKVTVTDAVHCHYNDGKIRGIILRNTS